MGKEEQIGSNIAEILTAVGAVDVAWASWEVKFKLLGSQFRIFFDDGIDCSVNGYAFFVPLALDFNGLRQRLMAFKDGDAEIYSQSAF